MSDNKSFYADEPFEQNYWVRRAKTVGLSYAVPVAPYPGEECLEDLLIRAACENGFHPEVSYRLPEVRDRSGNIRAPGGSSRLGFSPEKLAVMLGNPGGPEELRPLLEFGESPGKWLRPFFDVWIHNRALSRHRRVSPLALRKRPFLRAMWRVWPLAFDPETKEYLLADCPECDKRLGGGFMGDVWCCDHCNKITDQGKFVGIDLRDYPQKSVEEELWERLDFVTGLIDPSKIDVRPALRGRLHRSFENMHDGAVFDFTCRLAKWMAARGDHEPSFVLPPEVLAEAAGVVQGWPASFEALVATNAEAKRPKGHSLQYLFFDTRVDAALRQEMKEVARRFLVMPLIERAPGGKLNPGLYDRFGFIHLRRLVVAKEKASKPATDVELQVALLRARSSVRAFAESLGVPVPTLVDMVEDGLLPDSMLASEDGFVDAANDFFKRLTASREPSNLPDFAVPLPNAVATFFARPGDPWSVIFEAILSGRIKIWHLPKKSPVILDEIYVSDLDALFDVLSEERCNSNTRLSSAPLTAREACRWTRLWNGQQSATIKAKILSAPYSRNSLGNFASQYETTIFVQLRLKVGGISMQNRYVRRLLSERGAQPAAESKTGSAIWRRKDVEACFGNSLARCLT
ncbi:hypothetical protein [Rhizobium leguminosarum]|uniref:TniQ family protein n=1 Tax=Rhizobium leguminosarum TaxID=384 RepID=A0A7M3DW87_RHILE|nr:hypothetical protein [Rhizobium leguminosarum]NKK44935.1 hypothetical protein [Rhizobium leguminosarum bv. viciae]TAY52882.1 hypothetical protein ELH90_15190 [Rhizobium leguminosarum]